MSAPTMRLSMPLSPDAFAALVTAARVSARSWSVKWPDIEWIVRQASARLDAGAPRWETAVALWKELDATRGYYPAFAEVWAIVREVRALGVAQAVDRLQVAA